AGDFAAYLTDSGGVYAGLLSEGTTVQLDPFAAGDDGPQYTADAIALDERGMLFAYSRDDATVVLYDITSASVRSRDGLDAEGLSLPAITAAAGTWAVVDTEDGEVWLKGTDAVA